MGYFEGLASAGFKRTKDGRTAFYPYGILGSGYVLLTDKEKTIRRFVKTYLVICLPLATAAASLFRFYALALLPFVLPLYYFPVKKLLKGSEKIEERLSYKENIKSVAGAMGAPVSVLMLISSILMTAASAFVILIEGEIAIGIIGLLFFGFGSFTMYYLVKYSINSNNSKGK